MSFEAHPVSSTYKPAEDSSIQDKLVNGSSKLKENRPTKQMKKAQQERELTFIAYNYPGAP
jgi:hypothetical protein